MQGMRIGEVARQTGVNLQTVHYYERRGLLARPPRTASNYRLYTPEAIRRIRFVKRAQELGFSLSEIQELLSLRATPRSHCGQVRVRAEAKLKNIQAKIRLLRAMRRALSRLVAQCSGKGPVSECPILESLDQR